MFDKSYEERLRAWSEFRKSLEKLDNPIQETIDRYNMAPRVSMYTDPWTPSMWPSPWELIAENQYCDFCNLLGICYTLQLTDKFFQSQFEIHIVQDRKISSTHYLLYVDDFVIGYYDDKYIHKSELPNNLYSQWHYTMPKLQ
jgi:hypothetical protein